MNEAEENAYVQGHRAAWLNVLYAALNNLGYKGEEMERLAWIGEREEAIQALRSFCRDHEGADNDWEDNLYLPDIINNHLGD